MKRKNYIYKLCATNRIYADRDSAVQAAFNNIKKSYTTVAYSTRISSPILLKVAGGYKVACFDENGRMLSRKLDVFVASEKKRVIGCKTLMARHELKKASLKNPFGWKEDDENDDDSCDFDCDDCPRNSFCEDAWTDEDDDEDGYNY